MGQRLLGQFAEVGPEEQILPGAADSIVLASQNGSVSCWPIEVKPRWKGVPELSKEYPLSLSWALD